MYATLWSHVLCTRSTGGSAVRFTCVVRRLPRTPARPRPSQGQCRPFGSRIPNTVSDSDRLGKSPLHYFCTSSSAPARGRVTLVAARHSNKFPTSQPGPLLGCPHPVGAAQSSCHVVVVVVVAVLLWNVNPRLTQRPAYRSIAG